MGRRRAATRRARVLAAPAALFALFVWVAASSAVAQTIELRVAPGPHYVGDPVDVEVHTEGFERSPEPSCLAPPPADGTLHLRGISPNVQSSIQIINGRMTRSERVRFVCHFQFIAQRPGRYALGPFTAEQRGRAERAGPLEVEVVEIPVDRRFTLSIGIPDEPVFVGQHVPIPIEWWLGMELRDQVQRFVVRSELFEREEDFRFIEDQRAAGGERALVIDTPDGELELAAQVTEAERDGAPQLVVSALRTLVPMRPGEYALAPGVVQVEEVVRWRRDLFGRRTPARTRRRIARDEPRTLVVLEPPRANRPASYAGAVGRGFTLDVSADRSVVQVGDPITLTVRVRGDGNLRVVGLPPLDADGGLSAEAFRLPEADPSGRMTDDAKVFEVAVRVLDADVREVPALAYSWFDPETGSYQTTRSRPIALSVRPAEVVSAGDVVSGQSAGAPGDAQPERESAAAEGREPDGSFADALAVQSADLAIERDPDLLLRSAPRRGLLEAGLYGAGLLALAAGAALRMRSGRASGAAETHRVVASARARIAGAASGDAASTSATIASALREVLSADPALGGPEFEDLLRRCDEQAYAPEGAAVGIAAGSLRTEALALLEAGEGGRR